jgi:hypothetical protein
MSSDRPITRENLNIYLKDLAREFRKLNGNKTPAEIVLIGGAAILAGYGFRDMTYDIDALIVASSAMKDASGRVADKHGLPRDWLNSDFRRTASYSDKLFEVSEYYLTLSNILTIRMVTAEYLAAMKLMSGRQYKNDISDVAGILLEHQNRGTPLTREMIDAAVIKLYGTSAQLPSKMNEWLNKTLLNGDYEAIYRESRMSEQDAKAILLDFEERRPGELRGDNLDAVIEAAKIKRESVNRNNEK